MDYLERRSDNSPSKKKIFDYKDFDYDDIFPEISHRA
jgi:hypothetical protein